MAENNHTSQDNPVVENQSTNVKGKGKSVGTSFTNLPIGQLISAPFVEMAKGQAALREVYMQTLFKIAFQDASQETFSKDNQTRTLDFTYSRPVIDEVVGTCTQQKYKISAPLLSLVPVPAFLMESADVSFDMEVNNANTDTSTNSELQDSNANFSFWASKANVEGKISSSSRSADSSSQKTTYSIAAHAAQQLPSEGMAKLTALLAETMEPIKTDNK